MEDGCVIITPVTLVPSCHYCLQMSTRLHPAIVLPFLDPTTMSRSFLKWVSMC